MCNADEGKTTPFRRLSEATLPYVPALPQLPYDRSALKPGIVHIGVGAFHRAHQAVFTHRALAALPPEDAARWGTVGVSMRSSATCQQLGPQDGLYTVHERSTAGVDVLLIGCILRCAVAPHDPQRLIELLASPDVRVVSLTVTEKGCCYEPSTRTLDLSNADIVHDLDPANRSRPRSAIGLLVAALQARRAHGVVPFTPLSCDNVPHNGATLRACCVAFAERLDRKGDLAEWLGSSVPFPCTMVDGIVPATSPADIDAAAAPGGPLGGLRDEAMVVCEPFRQWVIEDSFGPLGRPPWELAGAQVVKDVGLFEAVKLQCLNGCHSALAYTGALSGMSTVAEAMADTALAVFARNLLVRDVLPSLTPPEGVDLHAYGETVLERFSNEALQHKTVQIAMDGSQKLPQRLLTTARSRLDRGDTLAVLPLAIAAWMRYVTRCAPTGEPVQVADPLANRFAAIAAENSDDAEAVTQAMFAIEEVFGSDKEDPVLSTGTFRTEVTRHLAALVEAGDDASRVRQHVAAVVAALAPLPGRRDAVSASAPA